jgi:DNA-binding XRE family transcriptional regulator
VTALEVLSELVDAVRRLDEELALALGDTIADIIGEASDHGPRALHDGLTLRKLRRVRGLSMADVADRMGVTVATVSRWEAGKMGMSFEHVSRLSDVLEGDVWRLQKAASSA